MADCGICGKINAGYKCPKCGIQYCSLSCYQSQRHAECSELFYKESVVNEISNLEKRGNDEMKKKMIEMLNKFETDDFEEEEEEEESLEDRLKGLDLDSASPEEILLRLTPPEQSTFMTSLHSLSFTNPSLPHINVSKNNSEESVIKWTDVQELIWKPWWLRPRILVSELEVVDHTEGTEYAKVPEVSSEIVPLEKITKIRPVDTIFFSLIDLLFSYVVACRHLNGEKKGMVEVVSDISVILNDNKYVPSGIDDIVIRMQNKIFEKSEYGVDLKGFVELLSDVEKILGDEGYTVSALSDLHSTFQMNSRKKTASERKIYYFLCLVADAAKHKRVVAGKNVTVVGVLSLGLRNEIEKLKIRLEDELTVLKSSASQDVRNGTLIREI